MPPPEEAEAAGSASPRSDLPGPELSRRRGSPGSRGRGGGCGRPPCRGCARALREARFGPRRHSARLQNDAGALTLAMFTCGPERRKRAEERRKRPQSAGSAPKSAGSGPRAFRAGAECCVLGNVVWLAAESPAVT